MAGSLIGAGIGLVGSMMSSRAQDRASARAAEAARFDPYNTSGVFGSSSFDQTTGNANWRGSPIYNMAVAGAAPQLAEALDPNNPLSQIGQGFQEAAAAGLPNLYADRLGFGMPSQGFLDQYTATGQTAANAMMTGGSRIAGAGNAMMQNGTAGFNEAMGLGRDLLGSTAQSYDQVAADRLGLLREQAEPFETRATDSLMNRLFSQGRMGSTGGGRDIESFARGLAQADTSRQLDSQTFAEQLYGRDLNAALTRQGMGANLFGMGAQGDAAARQAGAQMYGSGMDAMGAAAGMRGDILNAQTAWNQFGFDRAGQRVMDAQNMFGFGQGMETGQMNEAGNWLNFLNTVDAARMATQNQGAAYGGQAAAAGAAAAPYISAQGGSPLGGFFSGMGQGMMTGQIPVPSFGGSVPPSHIAAGYQPVVQPAPVNFSGPR